MTKEERAAEDAWNNHVRTSKGWPFGPSSNYEHGFLDGIAYRDQNPSDEVLKLVEALEAMKYGANDLTILRGELALSQWRKARGE